MGGFWEENEPLSEINVTPFVDVLLVLLIIFMITAPIVNHVIQVDLPEDSYNQDVMKPLQEPLRVVIDKAWVLYLVLTRIGLSFIHVLRFRRHSVFRYLRLVSSL